MRQKFGIQWLMVYFQLFSSESSLRCLKKLVEHQIMCELQRFLLTPFAAKTNLKLQIPLVCGRFCYRRVCSIWQFHSKVWCQDSVTLEIRMAYSNPRSTVFSTFHFFVTNHFAKSLEVPFCIWPTWLRLRDQPRKCIMVDLFLFFPRS